MKVLYIIGAFFVLFLLIEFLLPRFFKKKSKAGDPFTEMDNDFGRFFDYFFPKDWQYILSIQKENPKGAQKLFDDLKKKLFEQYPDYFEKIDAKFLKNYFG